MATNPYPHLGWNPVPGISSEVDALQRKVSSAARALRSCHGQIQKLVGESSYWEGDAATKFREALDGELPEYIKRAAQSLEKAEGQLKIWDGELTANQDLAKKYDEDARDKKAAASRAQNAFDDASRHPDLNLANTVHPTATEAEAATERLRAAERNLSSATASLNAANESYNDVIKKARTLDSEHSERASKIADSLSDSTDDLAPEEPGWFESFVSGIWEGIKTAAQFLLDHAGTIGAIAGLLALLPTPLAPAFAAIALVASMASMGKNFADPKFRDALFFQGSPMEIFSAYASLAGDTVGMIPGGKALAFAGKELAGGLQMADEMGVAVTRAEKATEYAREFGHVFKKEAIDGSYGALTRAGESTSGALKYVGNFKMNEANVGANVMSSLESEGALADKGATHNVAEGTKATATAWNIAGLFGLAP